jgi:phosphoglycolate phosphatase
MKHFPLLIFDWDGTLVDSIARIVSSLQFASRQVTGNQLCASRARDVIGLGLAEAIAKLHPELHANDQTLALNSIADAYRQHYLYDNTVPAPLFAGVEELLDGLFHQGYTLAISTGKSRIGLEHAIKEHNMGEYFATTRCAGENRSKPHPEMLHEILHELNFCADEALMIGDSEHDLMMANNARVSSIGVTHGVHDARILKKHKPLVCLNKITELSGFLDHN